MFVLIRSAVILSSSPASVLLSASSEINSAVSSSENPCTAGVSFFFRVASFSVKDSERPPSLTTSLGLEVVEEMEEMEEVEVVEVIGWRGPNVRN